MASPGDRKTTRPATDHREVDVTDQTRPAGGGATGTTRGATAPGARDRDDHPVVDRSAAVAGNGHAIAALVLGLLSATYAFLAVSAIAAVIAGIFAIGFGAKGMSVAKDHRELHKGLAISGIVSGVLGLLLGIAVIVGAITLGEQTDLDDLPPAIQDPVEEVID